MIRMDEFLRVMHGAVLSANEALMKDTLNNLMNTYFEEAQEAGELQSSLSDAIESLDEVSKQTKPSKESIQKAMKAFTFAREALREKGGSVGGDSSSLRPKSVEIEIPEQTDHGISMRKLRVPLITLVPVSVAQIAEVKFRSNMEFLVDGDDIMVSFPNKGEQVPKDDVKASANGGTVEITIIPQKGADGLQELISGFTRSLRGQIPH